jgi:hypothetical protein
MIGAELMRETKQIIISATIIVVSIVLGLTIYMINDRVLMSKNIDNAISKGVDAISIRCSYADSRDMICVAYGASHNVSNKK